MQELGRRFYEFNGRLAEEVGVEKAVILADIYSLTQQNFKKENYFHDGRRWMVASSVALHGIYPFWSANKIQKMLKSLVNAGYLLSGNYNESMCDRTLWYSPSDHVIDVYNLT